MPNTFYRALNTQGLGFLMWEREGLPINLLNILIFESETTHRKSNKLKL